MTKGHGGLHLHNVRVAAVAEEGDLVHEVFTFILCAPGGVESLNGNLVNAIPYRLEHLHGPHGPHGPPQVWRTATAFSCLFKPTPLSDYLGRP